MTYLFASILIVLAIGLWFVNSRNQYNLVALAHGALTIIVFCLIAQDILPGKSEFVSNGYVLAGLLTGILLVNIAFSYFWKGKSILWPPLFVFISSFLLLTFGEQVFNYRDFSVQLSSIGIFLIPFLGACVVPIANAKERVLGIFFKIDFKNRQGISRSVYFFLFGIFILISHFLASYVGIALFSLGFGASLFYNKSSNVLWNMLLALLAVTLLGYFAGQAAISESSLLNGRVVTGIFISGFISLFINTLQRAKSNKRLATLLMWFVLLFFPSILILAVSQNVNFGGADTYIGLLVGFSMSAIYGVNTRKNDTVLAVYLALGIFWIPLTVNKEEQELTKIELPQRADNRITDPFEMASQRIDLLGEYSIISKNAQLSFELGQTGSRTKGAFKTVLGKFIFGENNLIQVDIPVKSLTTFNSYRDESLMEEAYFFEEKHPSIHFESTSIIKKGKSYEVKGKFTMLKSTKELTLEMKYLGKSTETNNLIFIGRSSLNRVDFGMKSDPKEGDIVDFQFKVELSK